MLPGPCQPHNKGLETTLTLEAWGKFTLLSQIDKKVITYIPIKRRRE